MSYDEKCYELAQWLLPKGTDDELVNLATQIRETVEAWLEVEQE